MLQRSLRMTQSSGVRYWGRTALGRSDSGRNAANRPSDSSSDASSLAPPFTVRRASHPSVVTSDCPSMHSGQGFVRYSTNSWRVTGHSSTRKAFGSPRPRPRPRAGPPRLPSQYRAGVQLPRPLYLPCGALDCREGQSSSEIRRSARHAHQHHRIELTARQLTRRVKS